MKILNFDDYITSDALVYSKQECAFCNEKMDHYKSNTVSYWDRGAADTWGDLLLCKKCGWWYAQEGDGPLGDIHLYSHQGILKEFKADAKNLPLEILQFEIKKRPEILYHIHHKKMEELAQSVFASFYNCEVLLCGKSGDGGVDLMIINSDKPIAVQVKRRTKIDAKEGVEEVTRFIGALTIKGLQKGIFLTTAKEFTKGALNLGSTIANNPLINSIELINFDDFVNIFSLTDPTNNCPWNDALQFGYQTGFIYPGKDTNH